MNLYELALVLDSSVDDSALDGEIEKIENGVIQHEGKPEEWEKWGRRGLSYEIKGKRDGYYAFLRFRALPKMLVELDRALKLNESVLRYMIVKIDERKRQVIPLKEEKVKIPSVNFYEDEEVEEYG